MFGFLFLRILPQPWKLSMLSQTKIENHSLTPTQPTQTFIHTMELEFNFSWRMSYIPEIDQQVTINGFLLFSFFNPFCLFSEHSNHRYHGPMTHSEDSLTGALAWARSHPWRPDLGWASSVCPLRQVIWWTTVPITLLGSSFTSLSIELAFLLDIFMNKDAFKHICLSFSKSNYRTSSSEKV